MNILDWKFFLLMVAVAVNFHCTDALEKTAERKFASTQAKAFLLFLSTAPAVCGLVAVIIQFFREPWYTVVISMISAAFTAGLLEAVLWQLGLGKILWLFSYPWILVAACLVYRQ